MPRGSSRPQLRTGPIAPPPRRATPRWQRVSRRIDPGAVHSGERSRPLLVANEVGMGLVPKTPLGREFRDAAGRLNQEIAALADRVVFVAAGLPLVLKGGG